MTSGGKRVNGGIATGGHTNERHTVYRIPDTAPKQRVLSM